ncbi:MAG: M56 family metallopeptidase [Verrucomicrobiota bacterium]|jgi:beta-lactamase regulating signal transducer with metallopeptidase domain
MNTWNYIVLTLSSPRASAALLEVAGKSFLILAAAFPLALGCRRSAAATRHFIWLAALAGLLTLPLATVWTPRWNTPAWAGELFRRRPAQSSGNAAPALVTSLPLASGAGEPSAVGPRSLSPAATAPPAKRFPWRSLVLPGWAAGVVLTLLVCVGRRWSLRKIERAARPVTDPEVLGLRDSALRELGLRRKVRLLQTGQPLMPMTWGFWRPAALLPADAAKWERERLRLVLRHELAHVRRGDCLAQALASVACAFYWFNPLAWLAAARMRVERERACDDLVVALGHTRPSEYAGHLLDIARQLSAAPRAALPVARQSGLEQRLRALLDGANHHGGLTRRAAAVVTCALAACLVALAGWRVTAADTAPDALRQQLIARLQTFSALKEKQSEQLAAAAGEKISPEFQGLFDAAIRGDGQYVTNRFEYYRQHHPQYEGPRDTRDASLRTSYWGPVLEICLAYNGVVSDEPEYVREFAEDIIQSIPAGSVYFGGTDPGRGLVTAFCPSQPQADPFFTLTQNALADPTYLDYLRRMYGGRIYVPTKEDTDKTMQNFVADVQKRLAENKLKEGEHVTNDDGRMDISGQVVVMEINAMLARIIFDRDPDREFYIEESFPLDWMYPNLEPHGLILKLNRAPLPELGAATVQRDQDYWQPRVQEMIGGWLRPETPLKTVLDFVEKTYGRKDLSGFAGNPRLVGDANSQQMFSKLRSTIAGVYAWRVGALKAVPTPGEYLAPPGAERQRMSDTADLAFRQAFALCPHAPEAVYRYADFLVAQGRKEDAILLLETASRLPRSPDPAASGEMAKVLADLKARKSP